MKKLFLLSGILIVCLSACKKDLVTFAAPKEVAVVLANPVVLAPPNISFVQYNIKAGEQYCDKNFLTAVQYNELKFWVKFDSTAMYTTLLASNQNDINKLYGFSDNEARHHEFSARFGWRWSGKALRLFAYVYNSGERSSVELGAITINAAHYCSIKVDGDKYIFTLNDKTFTMPRTAKTVKGIGYKLYPYFGGDELAPQNINIRIKELP